MKLDWKHSGLSKTHLEKYGRKLSGEIKQMNEAANKVYDTEYASINLPLDDEHLLECLRMVKKHKKAKLIVVAGIGGSNLGTWAVQEAIQGQMHNLSPGKRPQILFADNVDSDKMQSIITVMESHLRKRHHVVVNVVTKSGATMESVANGEILVKVLKKNKRDPKKHLVFTTQPDSKVWHYATDNGFDLLVQPKNVGGRYSVFSPVGLFPLALAGVNVASLLDGAAHMRAKCLRKTDNPAIIRAAMLHRAWKDERVIANNFYFKADLERIGKWYRQLMGESLGKEWDKAHEHRLWMGITPIISTGTTDLHSMAQLYFGGPSDKFHTLVTVRQDGGVKVPRFKRYGEIVPSIQGKHLTTLMATVVRSVAKFLGMHGRPYCIIELENSSEECIGELLQLHMMEMIYLGALLGVNPFDQPNVEEYKVVAKRMLSRL